MKNRKLIIPLFTVLLFLFSNQVFARFLAVDPVRAVDQNGKINQQILTDPQRLNLYSYSLNNPYRYIDFDGRNPGPIHPGNGPFGQVDIRSGIAAIDNTVLGMVNTAANTTNFIFNSTSVLGSDDAIALSQSTPFPHDDAAVGIVGGAFRLGSKWLPPAVKAFDKAGIKYTEHFATRISGRAARGITPQKALDTYNNGRLYYNPATTNYIRHSSQTRVSVAVSKPSRGTAITVFEGKASPDWVPVKWRSGNAK